MCQIYHPSAVRPSFSNLLHMRCMHCYDVHQFMFPRMRSDVNVAQLPWSWLDNGGHNIQIGEGLHQMRWRANRWPRIISTLAWAITLMGGTLEILQTVSARNNLGGVHWSRVRGPLGTPVKMLMRYTLNHGPLTNGRTDDYM